MRIKDHGRDGPLVIKLAGIAGGTGLYAEEIAAAQASGFRVVALDVSGDRRDDPSGRPLSWDLYAQEVQEAIDQSLCPRAILWGTSFGCLIALSAASRYPERVSGLVLTHPPDPLWRPRLHLALLDFALRCPVPHLVARTMFSTAFLGLTSWEALSPPLWPRLPSLIRAAVDARTPAATVKRKIELLFRDQPGLPPPESTIPVEIIAGAWDLVAPLAGARRLASRIPGAQVRVLRFAGHAASHAHPRTHFNAVLEALRRMA